MSTQLRFQALLTCLYDGTPKTFKSNEVMITVCPTPKMTVIKPKNDRSSSCKCELSSRYIMLLLLKYLL